MLRHSSQSASTFAASTSAAPTSDWDTRPASASFGAFTTALIITLIAAIGLCAVPRTADAHQLSNGRGALVPHKHVFRRVGYGNSLQTGHVAPTRHGNDMIIWSPAPSGAYDLPAPQVQFSAPDRSIPQQNKRVVPSPSRMTIPTPNRDRR